MKKLFKHIKEDRLLFWSFILSAVFIFVSTLLIALFYQNLPPFLPLFNGLPWGYARIGSKIAFFIPVLLAWVLIGINMIVSSMLYTKIVLLARFIAATAAAASITILIFTIQILLLIH